MRDELKEQLVLEEGLRLRPYQDTAGKWTIGVGRNLTDTGISQAEAYWLMDNDINRVVLQLNERLPYFGALDPVRQDVLIDMCFNLGIAGLLQFRMMLSAVSLGNYETAAEEMMKSNWSDQVGRRAYRLSEQMRTGKR
jgi:lysozyme